MGKFCDRATETLDNSGTVDKVVVWPLRSFLPSSIQKLLFARYVSELHSRTYVIVGRIKFSFPVELFLKCWQEKSKWTLWNQNCPVNSVSFHTTSFSYLLIFLVHFFFFPPPFDSLGILGREQMHVCSWPNVNPHLPDECFGLPWNLCKVCEFLAK